MLQRQNADAAYYGKSVSTKDKDRILFRWQLETAEYQVIFGDLAVHRLIQELFQFECRSTLANGQNR